MLLTQTGIRSAGALGMLLVAAGAAHAGALAPQKKAPADSRMSTAQAQQRLTAARSARFIENKGQWDSHARFVAKGPRLNLWFTDSGIRYDQHLSQVTSVARGQAVDMFFRGGRAAKPEGRFATGSRADYYTGGKPALGVRSYGELYTRNVVGGVDMRSYYDGGRPRYDLIVAPGADPKSIRLGFRGADGLSLRKGELNIGTHLGGFTNGRPFAYQTVNGKQKPVAVRWALDAKDTATFALGKYDRSRPLVIDPVVYGTYFGGDGGADEVRAVTSNTVAGGGSGSVLVTGATKATQFPTSTGFYNYNNPNGVDAFLSRLQGDAYNRDYAVYMGGRGSDTGQYIKLDAFGNVWIAGTTTSPNFFSTAGTTLTNSDIFVMRFTLQAGGLLVPTNQNPQRFGSTTTNDVLTGFDVLRSSPASSESPTILVLSGNANGAIPEVPGAYPTGDLEETGYVLRVNYLASTNSFATQASSSYMVGNGGVTNETRGVVFDTSGSFYVAGTAYGDGTNQNTDPATGGNATLFTTTPGVFASTASTYDGGSWRLLRGSDLFVRKYNPDGSINYSGLIGGSGADECGGIALGGPNGLASANDLGLVYTGSAIAVDSTGNAYVTGVSRSFNFPRTNGVYGEVFNQFSVVTVTKINASGSAFLYSTNLNTSNGETAAGISAVAPAGIGVDPEGNAFVTGNLRADSIVFPQTPGDPNQPTSSTVPSINIPASLTDVPDPTYTTPTGAEFPTSEGFLMVLNSTGTTLQYATYIGGILDDLVYAPYVDDNGDVWAMGWTDGHRFYQRASSATPPAITRYDRFGNLPASLISPLALKASIDVDNNPQNPETLQQQFAYGVLATQGTGSPNFVAGSYARDGFIVKIRVNRPSVGSITLNPSTIPGGLGASSVGTVTLSAAAPSGGAQVTISLPDGTNNASLSATSDVSSITVTIAAGATTANFTVYSKPVTANSTVAVRATYTGTFKQTTLQVVPWLVSLTLPQSTVVGGNTIAGTITLAAPAPAGGVDISIISSSSKATITSVPFTIPAGQTSALFTIETDGVDTDTPVTIQASLLGVTRSAGFTLQPASLQSVTVNPDTVAGGSTSSVTVTLNGEAGDVPYDVTLSVPANSGVAFANGLTSTVVSVPAGASTSVAVTINTAQTSSSKTVTITAFHAATSGHPAVTKTTTLRVLAVSIASLSLDPTTVDSGAVSTATVTLDTAAPTGGAKVYLSVAPTAYAKLLSSSGGTLLSDSTGVYVLVPASLKTATFQVQARYFSGAAGATTPVTVTAAQAGSSKTATLNVRALNLTFTLDRTSVTGSANGTVVTGTITIPTAANEALTFSVVSSNAAVTVDTATVTIAAGSRTATFTLRAGSVNSATTVAIKVGLIDAAGVVSYRSTNLQITAVGIASLVPQQTVIRSGTGYLDLTVNFTAPTTAAGTLTLTHQPELGVRGRPDVHRPGGHVDLPDPSGPEPTEPKPERDHHGRVQRHGEVDDGDRHPVASTLLP